MKVFERLLGRGRADEAHGALSLDEWAQFFGPSFAPFLQQTWKSGEEAPTIDSSSAYSHNGPVFSLVLARMQVFAQARFAWTRFSGGMPGDPFGTAELSILEKPWPGGTTGDLLARMELDASRAGNAFVRRIGNRLVCLPPQWCTVVIGSQEDADHPGEAADAEMIGLVYKPPNAAGVVLEPSQFAMYAPVPDPDNRFVGMSWITPVLRDVMADDASMVHKRKFFENAATPNLAIKFDPAVSKETVQGFKELLEAEHQGAFNAYKTLFLGGGADPVVIGKDFKELDFAVTQGKGESRLASAAGVPPSWVGFSEGLQGSALNAGNFTAARRRFGDGTMHHLWSNAAASLASLVRAPKGATLWYDTRGIPFMREDAKDAADVQSTEASTIGGLIKEGFTPESVIAAVRNNDWALLKHSGLVSVQLQTPGAEPPQPTASAEGED